jgi:metal-responsive CopG/Arc/MetJ family transcriptional regulator
MTKHRLQFDFSEEALRQLDELKDTAGVATRADLIRHALRWLQWTLTETQKNKATLLVEKNGQVREVVLPFLTGSETRPYEEPEPEVVGKRA